MSAGNHVMLFNLEILLVWGSNKKGQLGLGHKTNQTKPTPLNTLTGLFYQVAVGRDHSLILMGDSSLYGCGYNRYGQVGMKTEGYCQLIPGRIGGICGEIVRIACGRSHSMALLRDGSLYSWGKNDVGQLGVGHTQNLYLPTRVTSFKHKIIQIECGNSFSVALTREGLVYSWGSNSHGELGIGIANLQGYKIPQIVPGITKVTQLSCGLSHVLAIRKNGELYSWGDGTYGQLGREFPSENSVPSKVDSIPSFLRVLKVACGGNHSLALLSDGLYAWGSNGCGQLGIDRKFKITLYPTEMDRIPGTILQMKCGYNFSMVITSNYDLYHWGNDNYENQQYKSVPTKITLPTQTGKVFFERDYSMKVIDWPNSHYILSKTVQAPLEELLLVLKEYILKDIAILIIKAVLLIL